MPLANDHGTPSTHWSAEQIKMANIIIGVGNKMGMSKRDILIGLMTAMQESGLKNVNYGDRDSLGLFQQRPSQGWGSAEQVTDPVYAAHKFFSVLRGVDGRDKMALTAAAQAVQRSAYPDAYAKWEGDARALLGGGKTKIMPAEAAKSLESLNFLPAGTTTTAPNGQVVAPQPTGTPMATLGATTEPLGLGSSVPGVGQAGVAVPQMGSSAMQPFQNVDDYQSLLAQQGLAPNMGQAGVNQSRLGVVNFAKQFLGTPYVWGGTDLNSGVDCSGFVQQVYKHFGIDLPRVSYQQANYGKRIDLGKLKPGDLVAWDLSSRNNGADHIAIYIGGGKIIEAPRPGRSVQISNIYDANNAWGVRLKT